MIELGIVPCGNRIILKQQSLEKTTDSGIVIKLENEKAEQAAIIQGTLIAVGEDSWDQWSAPWAKVGQEVYFAKYAGKNVYDPKTKETYLIMNDIDIICTIGEEDD